MIDPIDTERTGEARRIAVLIARHICDTLGEEDRKELDEWILSGDRNMQLFEELISKKELLAGVQWVDGLQTEVALERIKAQLQFTPASRRVIRFSRWKTYAAAAVIAVVVGIGTVWVFTSKKTVAPPLVTQPVQDVGPGGEKAELILSNGQKVILEDVNDGLLTQGDSVAVMKSNGMLAYGGDDRSLQEEPVYNELRTPKGGTYAITFADGTKLWLNAASSVRYPVIFNRDERRIEVTGEAYLEVAKNSRPFRVQVNHSVIEVVGTHFDIRSYSEESFTETTLLEGAIRLQHNHKTYAMVPGEQARYNDAGVPQLERGVDLEKVVAWKNGYFQFRDADIPTVMKELARWYNVDISYEGGIPSIRTTGKAPRNISLDNLLKILSLSGVRYRIDNRHLIILP